jgi:hypothetical protein
VFGDFLDPGWWDPSASKHVGEEWPDVVGALRAAESDDEHSVKRWGHESP